MSRRSNLRPLVMPLPDQTVHASRLSDKLRPVIFRVTPELLDQCQVAARQNIENDVNPPVIPFVTRRVPQIVVEPPNLTGVPGAADAAAFHQATDTPQDQVIAVAA